MFKSLNTLSASSLSEEIATLCPDEHGIDHLDDTALHSDVRPATVEPHQVTTESASTVCVLDDDPSVLKATSRLLVSEGWPVKTFTNPDAFLRHAENCHPQVVVIDMWMPNLNGLEVQRRLGEFSPATRVIVLTANDDRVVRWKALAAGAAAFFIKPALGDKVIASIRSAFAAS
jgi:FixJ family two-component response regulator